jgi:DNA-binding transcriptional ArsR family regulator
MSAQEPRRRERSQPEGLSKDTIFSMLSNQRRRYVLYHLHRTSGTVPLRDLAEQIAAWENDVPIPELNYKQRKRVYTSLHQTHLPKLDEAGIVAYDRDRGTIRLADRAAELDGYLEVVGGRDLPWCDFYLGLSALALLVLLTGWLNLFPAALLPDLALAGLIVALFAGVAGAESYVARRNRIGSGPPLDGSDED